MAAFKVTQEWEQIIYPHYPPLGKYNRNEMKVEVVGNKITTFEEIYNFLKDYKVEPYDYLEIRYNTCRMSKHMTDPSGLFVIRYKDMENFDIFRKRMTEYDCEYRGYYFNDVIRNWVDRHRYIEVIFGKTGDLQVNNIVITHALPQYHFGE